MQDYFYKIVRVLMKDRFYKFVKVYKLVKFEIFGGQNIINLEYYKYNIV